MAYNIHTGHRGIRQRPNEEIIILVASLYRLRDAGAPFLFTDRHAYLQAAQFSSDLAELSRIDWNILQQKDFRRDPEHDLGKIERYEAEALVYQQLPATMLEGIVCHDDSAVLDLKAQIDSRGLALKVASIKKWFFR